MARNIDQLLESLEKNKTPEQQFQEKIAESILTTASATTVAPVVIEKTAEEKLAENKEIGKAIAESIWAELSKIAEEFQSDETEITETETNAEEVAEKPEVAEIVEKPEITESASTEAVETAKEAEKTEIAVTATEIKKEETVEKTAEQIQSEILLTLYQIYN